MILRKPYAFLIKHFKLLHAIITFFMLYVFYKTFDILSFFGDYILSSTGYIGQDIASALFDSLMFIFPVLIIIISIILLCVMVFKKKPSILYIINILIYICVLVLLVIGRNNALEMEISILDIRAVKLIRDLTTLSMLLQIYPLTKSFVRTVGFDIKQFDFGKDLAELEIEEKDNEEFEVSISVDTNKMKRGVNSTTRFSKYIYAENKFLINSIIIVVVLVVIGITTYGVFKTTEKTNMNATFSMGGLSMKVVDAYSTRTDYKGVSLSSLNDQMSLIVVGVNITNNSSEDNRTINTANIELIIGDHKFRHTNVYRDTLIDLGAVYDGEEILANTTTEKEFVFEVPTSYLDDKIFVRFITSISIKGKDLIPDYITVPLTLENLDDEKNVTSINNGEEISLGNSVLDDSILSITSIDISKRFKVDYRYCTSSSICVDSYEYLLAELNTNVDKSLLKIVGNITYDENLYLSSFNYLYDLINHLGQVRYEINGQTKTVTTGLSKVNPTFLKSNTTIYVSVPSEIESADRVSLVFNIRDQQYIYTIK